MLVSAPLFLAEVFVLGQLLLFYFQVSRRVDYPKASLSELHYFPWVDVFILTYNEPLVVLRRTAVACLAMEYPKKTIYILDDGRRPEVEQLALRLGCRYLTRPTNIHAKAGNINAALQRTSGELVVTFDCDHAPVRSFLQETVGFFKEPKVAYVQTVQHFYNPDPFQRNLFLREILTNEQNLFFKVIMPGRARYNAAFWTGTGAVFRRSALEELGGVLTDTLTEDLHTSLELHARGWRSVCLNRVLSAGLAPEGYSSYLIQRLRWTRGVFQVWWRANPLLKRGLSLGQRLCYFASIYYFLFGWVRLLFLTAPLAFLLFGALPLRATPLQLTLYYLPMFASLYAVFPLVSGGQRHMVASDIYETATSFFQAPTALKAFFFPRGGIFHVTPKGVEYRTPRFQWLLAAPQLGLVLLLALGFSLGLWRLLTGLDPLQRDATLINLAWAAYNYVVVTAAMAVAGEQPQRRTAYSVPRRLFCELGLEESTVRGETVHLSETGAVVELPVARPLPPLLTVKLYGRSGEVFELPARPVGENTVQNLHLVELQFVSLSVEQEDALIEFLFSPPSAWDEEAMPKASLWKGLTAIGRAPYRALGSFRPTKRPTHRYPLVLPATLMLGTKPISGRTVSVSLDELEVEVGRALTLEAGVRVEAAILLGREWPQLQGEVVSLKRGKKRTRVRVSLKLTVAEQYRWRERLQRAISGDEASFIPPAEPRTAQP